MELSYEEKQGIHIIKLSGNLLSDTSYENLLDHTQTQIDEGQKQFIIDLSGIDYMNSAGISVLIRLLTRTRQSDGDTVLAGVSNELSKILSVTKLNAVFDTYDTVDQAIKALK